MSVGPAPLPSVRPTERIANLLHSALHQHRSGQLSDAELRYREILAIDPNHVESLHLLGVIAHQTGRNEVAVDLIGKAIALNDRIPAFHNNIGLALREINRAQDAVIHYTRALDLKPDYAEARTNLGKLLREQGKLDEALAQYRHVLAFKPESAEAHNDVANALKDQGKLAEAVAQYEQALVLKPDYADAHNNLGNALKEQGKLGEAVVRYERALALKPIFPEAYSNLGNVLREQGKLDEAVAQYQRALALKPDYGDAHNNLGVTLREQGKLDEAVAHLRQGLELTPRAEAHNTLGNALRGQGKLDEAVAEYQKALALRPDYVNAHNNLGVALREQGKLDEAVAQYQRALALQPDVAQAHNNLGVALKEQGKLNEAVAHLRRSLELEPSVVETHCNLGDVLLEQGELEEAVAQYEQALSLKSNHARALGFLGLALRQQGKFEEAFAACRQALALQPDFAAAHAHLGHTFRDLGRLEEARSAYSKAIELAPQKGAYYQGLSTVKGFARGDADLAAMEKLASLSAEDQIFLGFALGKAYDDLGEPERSFRHLLASNALKRQRIVYDEAAVLGEFARIREVFSPELMRKKRDLGDSSPTPVFIIGMPRSGTTLIEQILASHPRIFGAGELANIARAARRLDSPSVSYPETVPSIGGEQLRQLGASYVAAVRGLAPNAERITDKMPHNFHYAGFINLILPKARIIHTRRDPVDTCLSCFSKYFMGHPYSYDLAELGRYYRAYEALMAHWREVLPSDVMLEVQYEEVVADTETQARRIVAYCGLEWDDACLSFHETQRPVRTASALQVRQPIYRSSVGRWRAYEHMLGPLLEALRGC
jgi:tetratricopeptide (TPR) repeat protein